MNKKNIIKITGFIGIIFGILLCNHYFGWSEYISNLDNIMKMKEAVGDNLVMVFTLYVVITIIGCVLLALPGVTFAVFAGILLGPVLGSIACLIATTLGAMIAFLVSRFFLKDAVGPMLEKNKILKKLLFTEKSNNDVIVLMITRLVPIFPYNLQNFAYGITEISFVKYSVLSFIFMMPGVTLYTVGAAGLTAGDDMWKYFAIAGIIAVAVTIAGIIIKKKYLKES